MEFWYRVINFVILIGIVILFGRKVIINIFKTRRERIENELDNAEKIENGCADISAASETEPLKHEVAVDNSEVLEAQKTADEKINQIHSFKERECNEIHHSMLKKAKNTLFELVSEQIACMFACEPLLGKLREKEPAIIEDILSRIALTPGDMSYLKHHDVLYVTLTSAFPLPEELVKRVDEYTAAMLAAVNGKTSLWVKVDPSLIGGLRLRIGDTVYDGTIEEQIYRLGKRNQKIFLENDDTVESIIEKFSKETYSMLPKICIYQLGRVMTISDGICWMDGLTDIMYGEVVEFNCGERGMVLDIQRDRIGCIIFGPYEHIESGSKVRRVGRIASVPVGEKMLGRVVNAIGVPVDGKGYITYDESRPIEFSAPGILDRAPVNKPLHTGLKAIDALVPIGRGQRELIIGDRQTGKSAIAVDAIINQKGKNTVCIYVAIGQKETTISEIKEKLEQSGAMEYTIIVAVAASDSAALQYIAPFSGTAMGEYFMYSGRDVLIVYDDMSKHAVAYRELSLLLHRPSGREAYPGDIFYLHSRLLERSAHLSDELGGGSMTALPIVETLGGDISSYIPTNVISITDGQIFLETDLFHEGQRPAVNAGLSVSRVGSTAQTKLMKQVSSDLRTKLAQYRELEDFTQFGTDIDSETKQMLDSGKRLMEILKQNRYAPLDDWQQALIIYAVSKGFADGVDVSDIYRFEADLYDYFKKSCISLVKELESGGKMSENLISDINEALLRFVGGLDYARNSNS